MSNGGGEEGEDQVGNPALRDWIWRHLRRLKMTQAALARYLDTLPPRISEIKRLDRRVNYAELQKLILLFGEHPPALRRSSSHARLIKVSGRVTMRAYDAVDETEPAQIAGHADSERFHVDDQVAFEITASVESAGLIKGDYVIAVPFGDYRADMKHNASVIFKRSRDDLVGWSLAKATVSRGKISYASLIGDIPEGEPDYIVIALRRGML